MARNGANAKQPLLAAAADDDAPRYVPKATNKKPPPRPPARPTTGYGATGDASQQQQQQYREHAYTELDLEEQLARERHAEIVDIHAEARGIREAYADFNKMVVEQQGGLDHAEVNVDNAANKVDKGISELVEARELQTKARKKMCVLAVIIVVIIAIVTVVIIVMTSDKKK